jgi:uncharacterized membrane protein
LDEYTIAFSRSLFSLPFLLPFLVLTGTPRVDIGFWLIVVSMGGLTSVAWILYTRAIKMSPLSSAIPMLSFTPVFLLVTSPIMIGESAGLLGLAGVLLVVLGTYVLSAKDMREGYFAPFKALAKEKGALVMLLVAALFSIGANLFKIGIQYGEPLLFIAMYYAIASGLLFVMTLKKAKATKEAVGRNLKILLAIGLTNAVVELSAMAAMQLAIVPYVISVKRTSIMFSTLYGHLFFGEIRTKERLTGTSIMLLGVFLVSCF